MTPLAGLARHFLHVSLLAVGGANVVIPEIHRRVVDVEHWMTDAQFAALFAIGNAAPGPNVMVVTLIGWHVAGLAGALVATLSMCGPSGLLTFAVVQAWDRYRAHPWRVAIQDGFAPVTVGMVASTAYILIDGTDVAPARLAITFATAIYATTTRLNPLWAFAAAGLIGALGWV